MRDKTLSLKKLISTYSSDEDKIKELHNQYAGEECFIFGCGPSLIEYPQDLINSIISDKLVLSIKQAILVYDADFHFCNDNNVIGYPKSNHTISCFSARNKGCYASFGLINQIPSPEIFTPIAEAIPDKALSRTLDFDEHLLEKTIARPWGPGIFTEIVLYMAVHLGVKRITTLGWDLSDGSKLEEGKHFYDNVIGKEDMLNPAQIIIEKDTQQNDIATTKAIYDWLKSRDIELVCASKNSYVHQDIPRIVLT